LLNSADGKIHLYFRGRDSQGAPLNVIHFSTRRQRPVFKLKWQTEAPFNTIVGTKNHGEAELSFGDVNFTDKSDVTADGQDTVELSLTKGTAVTPQGEMLYQLDFMSNVTLERNVKIKDKDGVAVERLKQEQWVGVPNDLMLFVGTLNGLAKKQVQSSLLLSGQTAFFDCFEQQSLYVFKSESGDGAGFVSCLENKLTPGEQGGFTPTMTLDGAQYKLKFEQKLEGDYENDKKEKVTYGFNLKETWLNVEDCIKTFINTLNGKNPAYQYSAVTWTKDDVPAVFYTNASQQRGLWFIAARSDATQFDDNTLKITIKDHAADPLFCEQNPQDDACTVDSADRCLVQMVLKNTDGSLSSVQWTNVPRQADKFNDHFQQSVKEGSEAQRAILSVVTAYALGKDKVVNIALNSPAQATGGALLVTAVNYGGAGKIEKTRPIGGSQDIDLAVDPDATILIRVAQGKSTSEHLASCLTKLNGEVPKHSGLFDVTCSTFPKDGHRTKVMHPDEIGIDGMAQSTEPKSVEASDPGTLGRWAKVPDNFILKIDNTANLSDGFDTTDSKPVLLTGEMGMEAWFKMPEPRKTTPGPLTEDTLTVVNQLDNFGGYSLDVTLRHFNNGSNQPSAKIQRVEAKSALIKGIFEAENEDENTDEEYSRISQWHHIGAMHQSGFYADLSPKPKEGFPLPQLYLDAGTDLIFGGMTEFTVEAMCFIKKNDRGDEQVIAAQWGADPRQQSWRLYITGNNKLAFDVKREDGNPNELVSQNAINQQADLKIWKHVAAVYSTRGVIRPGLEMDRDFWIKGKGFPGQTLSCEFWFQAYSDKKNRRQELCQLKDKETEKDNHFSFYITDENKNLFLDSKFLDNPIKIKDLSDSPAANHLAVTFDQSNVLVYINGIPQSPISVKKFGTDFMQETVYDWRFGGISQSDESSKFFNGFMTDIRLWTTVRTQEQIAVNAQSKLSGSETGLWSYLPFDDVSTELTDVVNTRKAVWFVEKGTLKNAQKSLTEKSQSIYVDGQLTCFE
jgi:hypothetical protein